MAVEGGYSLTVAVLQRNPVASPTPCGSYGPSYIYLPNRQYINAYITDFMNFMFDMVK